VVADRHQREGIGKIMLARLLQIAKERGKRIARSEVLRTNFHTIRLNDTVKDIYKMDIDAELDPQCLYYTVYLNPQVGNKP
jgi:GNAT superfamily N-acetyltransferase